MPKRGPAESWCCCRTLTALSPLTFTLRWIFVDLSVSFLSWSDLPVSPAAECSQQHMWSPDSMILLVNEKLDEIALSMGNLTHQQPQTPAVGCCGIVATALYLNWYTRNRKFNFEYTCYQAPGVSLKVTDDLKLFLRWTLYLSSQTVKRPKVTVLQTQSNDSLYLPRVPQNNIFEI